MCLVGSNNRVIDKLFFIFIAVVISTLLSLRPIPTLIDSNDTGRYLYEFSRSCAESILSIEKPTWITYFVLLRPLCEIGGKSFLLFVAALPLPISLLLLGRWKKSTLIWSLALLISVSGFELTTNALRQGGALLFLLWAIYLRHSGNIVSPIILWLVSVSVHTSNILYGPLLYIYHKDDEKLPMLRGILNNSMVVLVLLGVVALLSNNYLTSYFEQLPSIYSTYRQYYEQEKSVSFILFMAGPAMMVYLVRVILDRRNVTDSETYTFFYSSIVILMTVVLFPAIAYRLTTTSYVIQGYIAMVGKSRSLLPGGVVAFLSITHLVVFFLASNYAQSVLAP